MEPLNQVRNFANLEIEDQETTLWDDLIITMNLKADFGRTDRMLLE